MYCKTFPFAFKKQGLWILVCVLFISISLFLLKDEYKREFLFPLLVTFYWVLIIGQALHVLCPLAFTATLNGVSSYYSCFTDAEADLPKATEWVTHIAWKGTESVIPGRIPYMAPVLSSGREGVIALLVMEIRSLCK